MIHGRVLALGRMGAVYPSFRHRKLSYNVAASLLGRNGQQRPVLLNPATFSMQQKKPFASMTSSLFPSKPEDVVKPKPPDTWISDVGNYIDKFGHQQNISEETSLHAGSSAYQTDSLSPVQQNCTEKQSKDEDSSTSRTDSLNFLLRELQNETGVEFAIVALEDLGPVHSYGSTPEAYHRFCRDLFDSWAIGRRGVNDGMLLAVFIQGRRIEVLTGQGLASRSKYLLRERGLLDMQREVMVPLLRSGDHGGAIEAGARALVAANRKSSPNLLKSGNCGGSNNHFGGGRSQRQESNSSHRKSHDGWEYPFILVLICGPAILLVAKKEWDAEQERARCLKCGSVTKKVHANCLGDENDPKKVETELKDLLSPCEEMERKLGSCTFSLRQCPRCGTKTNGRRAKFLTPYNNCFTCGCRTERRRSWQTVEPTYSAAGRREVEIFCAHCGRHHFYTESIPRLKHRTSSSTSSGGGGWSSSSRSSGGGGFGGGSSSGGSSAGTPWWHNATESKSVSQAEQNKDLPLSPSDHVGFSIRRVTEWLRGDETNGGEPSTTND